MSLYSFEPARGESKDRSGPEGTGYLVITREQSLLGVVRSINIARWLSLA